MSSPLIRRLWLQRLIRAERKHVHTRTDGLGLDSVHGGIFGSFFKDAPAKNMLGRKVWPDVGVVRRGATTFGSTRSHPPFSSR
mmetsp:Transcript_32158/g.78339  ORF Transcript_32158/g.78339 Transcript_32158/m.78339 type:complete len:83 (-) Transcript_32158:171-419(-)